MSKKNSTTIKLREDFNKNQVVVLVDDVPVYRNDEYRGSMQYVLDNFSLTDDELQQIYRDYKKAYNRHFD